MTNSMSNGVNKCIFKVKQKKVILKLLLLNYSSKENKVEQLNLSTLDAKNQESYLNLNILELIVCCSTSLD